MPTKPERKVALVTGALTGIGRAAAIAFAQEGAKVVVSGRREKEGQELAGELRALGAEAIFVRTDVRNDEDVRKLVDQTVSRFGRLDIAVNNAGTEGTPGPVTEQTAESYAATFDTNVLGTLLSMKHELRVRPPYLCRRPLSRASGSYRGSKLRTKGASKLGRRDSVHRGRKSVLVRQCVQPVVQLSPAPQCP